MTTKDPHVLTKDDIQKLSIEIHDLVTERCRSLGLTDANGQSKLFFSAFVQLLATYIAILVTKDAWTSATDHISDMIKQSLGQIDTDEEGNVIRKDTA